MTAHGPRFIARAMVNLGQSTIDRMWAYHTGWTALEIGRVPSKLRREVLDTKLVEAQTQALDEVNRWAGEREATAPLILVGGVGVGKSYAAAAWQHHCAQRGHSIAWVSAAYLASLPLDRDRKRDEDRDKPIFADEERRALEADVLVIDDLGAGTLSGYLVKRINGLLLERDALERPTLVLMNADADDGRAWVASNIDPRLLDRQLAGGGDIVYLRPAKSMRAPKVDPDVDKKTGRGRAWKFAARLLTLIGVVDDFDGEAWRPESKHQILRPVFGGQLEATLVHSHDRDAIAESVRRMLGLDLAAVNRLAAEFEAQDESLRQMRGIAVKLEDGTTVDPGQMLARLREAAETERRSPGKIRSLGEILAEPEPERRSKQPPAKPLPEGERAKLAALGYLVRFMPRLEEFEVRHRPSKISGEPKPADKAEAARRKLGNALATGFETEAHAWAWAHEYALDQADHGKTIDELFAEQRRAAS